MKGYTLIELVAVIVILGLTFLIATPVINSLIDSSKDSLSGSQKKIFEKAAKEYVVSNYNKINGLDTSDGLDGKCIKIETLYSEGYIKGSIKDLKTSDSISEKGVFISYNDSINQYKYEFKNIDCKTNVTLTQ